MSDKIITSDAPAISPAADGSDKMCMASDDLTLVRQLTKVVSSADENKNGVTTALELHNFQKSTIGCNGQLASDAFKHFYSLTDLAPAGTASLHLKESANVDRLDSVRKYLVDSPNTEIGISTKDLAVAEMATNPDAKAKFLKQVKSDEWIYRYEKLASGTMILAFGSLLAASVRPAPSMRLALPFVVGSLAGQRFLTAIYRNLNFVSEIPQIERQIDARAKLLQILR